MHDNHLLLALFGKYYSYGVFNIVRIATKNLTVKEETSNAIQLNMMSDDKIVNYVKFVDHYIFQSD